MTFRVHGQPVTQIRFGPHGGACKVAAEWRIMAWAWAKGPQ